MKTNVTITEIEKLKDDSKMFRSLGRLFLAIPKSQCLLELNENKTTLEKEHGNYQGMTANFKEKLEHYTKSLNDMTKK